MLNTKVSDYKTKLTSYHRRVVDDREILRVSGDGADVVVLAADDFENLQETIHILKDEATMASLLQTRREIAEGTFQGVTLAEAFDDMGAPPQ